jgi:hypothetical protein
MGEKRKTQEIVQETVEETAKRIKKEKKQRKLEQKRLVEIEKLEKTEAVVPNVAEGLPSTKQPLADVPIDTTTNINNTTTDESVEKAPYVPSVENPEKGTHCLEYIRQWKESPSTWKFQKLKQAWILKHMWNEEKVPKDDFDIVKKYIKKLTGGAKTVR